ASSAFAPSARLLLRAGTGVLLAARGPRSRRAPVQSGVFDPWRQLTWQRSTGEPAWSCRHFHRTKRRPSHRAAGASQHIDDQLSRCRSAGPDSDRLSAFDPDGRSHPIGLFLTDAHEEAPDSAWANEKADE